MTPSLLNGNLVPVHVLSVSSFKGGVGKTTVTLGLASAAFSKGLRTLVIDLDPQSDVSTGLGVRPGTSGSVADVLAHPKLKVVRSAIAPSGWTMPNHAPIDVMVGSPSAINFDGPHPTTREIWKLEEALATIEADYDLVLIDCPPSFNALTRTAWAASDRVLVVTEPGLFSVAAADRALRAIEEVRKAAASDEIKTSWANSGAEFPNLTGAQFGSFVSGEIKKWAAVVKASGAKLD